MFNDEAIIHPALHHVGLTTGDMARLSDWYAKVLGMRLVYQSENPIGAAEGVLRPRAAWLSNDAANHRIALAELPGLEFDTERGKHQRLQHVAFAYRTLDELLGTYKRLKRLGIVPVLAVDEGAQIAFYYEDPDRNSVELNASNFGDFGDNWTSMEHMLNSPDFAKRPLGVDVDPDKLVAAREAGATPWELHKRAWRKEFAPATPYDPMVLL
ncbi:VOC family protein [Kumtagia ephedrae]|uniref:Biphenyl-2,3-diol 1,2-dioxygenase n=1 Tax=Kumtagia ephedrae TaxID=2116701 RepID=A0A2P7S4P6_9HYPH|nr:VOC family protein [Mesorhizobium ephedrae]PSJ57444.1 biphenyl-2,3-diol 1,2-dioxygenase [Mesorhizobium ephedrae]